MSGRKGVADRSRFPGPLVSPETSDDPRLIVQTMRTLRAEGWSYQRIGDRLFPDLTFDGRRRRVYKALNRERVAAWDSASWQRHREYHTSQDVARRRANAPACPRCGQKMSRPGVAPPCATCRSELYAERLKILVAAWNAGESTQSIAAQLGVNPRSIGTMLTEARRRGLPAVRRRPGRRSVIVSATNREEKRDD